MADGAVASVHEQAQAAPGGGMILTQANASLNRTVVCSPRV